MEYSSMQINFYNNKNLNIIPPTDAIRYSKHNITFIDFIEFIATDTL